MNRKGFTLIELLATLAILGIVVGITIVSLNGVFGNAKGKTEDVFVGTISDAMEMYLNSTEAKKLNFGITCSNKLNKTYGKITVYKATTTLYSVINSEYKPITQKDLVNPANEDISCNDASNIPINIYRDDDHVYYYSVDKNSFGCLLNSGVISSLPEGFEC